MKFVNQLGGWGWLAAIMFLASVAVFFSPDLREPIREFLSPPKRKVLSVATSRSVIKDKEIRIVKVLTPLGLRIEVYGIVTTGEEQLIDEIALADRRDGYFQFQGHAVNLALKDVDHDGTFEIIAPSYDDSLVPHLNVYRFNADSHKFEAYIE